MCHTMIRKYNVAGPRYTSYPTVPYWDNAAFSLKKWKENLKRSFEESNEKEGISLYIHLPFCESMCTFCGCNKRITKRHDVEDPYITSVIKEWLMYCDLFGRRPLIRELHLGGGTPTFFSPENLEKLIRGILRKSNVAPDAEFSFEGHPNNTTKEHLKALYNLGFRRVSYGVQDYDKKVQTAINRVQPFENVKRATEEAREIGYTSIGHDIIFGLPFQTEEAVTDTILKTKELMPDRLAFYSYAHVPWIKGNGQRGFKDEDLPGPEQKRNQYENGKKLLAEVGYAEIGMDHFALKTDSLHKAMTNGTLHRNFMGYTTSGSQLMIGLGVSSIGDSWYAFGQNVKSLEEYHHLVKNNIFPIYRGHVLSEEDCIIRKHILNLMCRFRTSWSEDELYFPQIKDILVKLQEMETDGLIEIDTNEIRISEKGRPFVRNVCMAFDMLLQRNKPETQLFSMTV
ncbi:oxygen-independent coproporphyrinogen III oxidase [Leptobacterium flavescens]|uniref:Coproporphyrinogen-III oxidase n=1 Tax=Leptobacterium flavescens TaxID=472055 RepID=A0A6P0UQP4_9FLAO|nr:oxygen-independent coproporphyrinogen III oxidase [Leptobacterium flavescens]NER14842.1 oxygen-independent coproporphyrinogen III oxidase [Leptobacterium flavescens]